jgi:hypothetical protein
MTTFEERVKAKIAARKTLGMTADQYNAELDRRVAKAKADKAEAVHMALHYGVAAAYQNRAGNSVASDRMSRCEQAEFDKIAFAELELEEAEADRNRGYAISDLEN